MNNSVFARTEYFYINDVRGIISSVLYEEGLMQAFVTKLMAEVFAPYYTCELKYNMYSNRFSIIVSPSQGISKAMLKTANASISADFIYNKLNIYLRDLLLSIENSFIEYTHIHKFPSENIRLQVENDFKSMLGNPEIARFLVNVVNFNIPLNKGVININFA